MNDFVIRKSQCTSVSRYRGMTLAEIMVAVGITVGMLLMIGTVFKSATDASGLAVINNELLDQTRTLTYHLEQDLSGLRPDMPMAIVFEAHQDDPDEPDKIIRYDRICFFASGNFQDMYGTPLSGNLARIFYGQMIRSPSLDIKHDVSPPRQILAKRYKIMTGDPDPSIYDPSEAIVSGMPPEYYDSFPFERASISFWKDERQVINDIYKDHYFNQAAVVSFVRPPDYVFLAERPDALQQLYFLPDVTDFKIQIYLYDKHQGRWRWFPDENDFQLMSGLSNGIPVFSFALYWNVSDMDGTTSPNKPTDIPDSMGNTISWWSETDESKPPMPPITFTGASGIFNTTWPKVIRFTFTLYDKHRRRFPEGQTFSYLVNVPSRN